MSAQQGGQHDAVGAEAARAAGLDRSHIPEGLARSLRAGRCFLFVGAGFSKNAGGSLFVPLLRDLCEKVPEDDQKPAGAVYSANELRALSEDQLWGMNNFQLDDVQFDLCRVLGYRRTRELLKPRILWDAPENVQDEYDRQRRALLGLNFAAAATWNWDNLLDLELAVEPLPRNFNVEDTSWTKVSGGSAAGGCGRRRLFKLNGSLSAEDSSPCAAVFGRDEYEAMENDRRRFHAEVGKRYSIITVGLRMESEETPYNPLGQRWWGPLGSAAGSSREHYVIVPQPAPGSAEEQRILTMEATYRVKVITFPRWDERGNVITSLGLAELLERIKEEVDQTSTQEAAEAAGSLGTPAQPMG